MHIRIRSPQDFWAGLLFIAVGLAFLWIARDYAQGTALRMGTGYVPRLLCYALVVLGIVVTFRGVTLDGPPLGGFAWRPVILILGSILLFAYSLERLGLVFSTFILIGIGSYSARDLRWHENLLLALGLSLFAVAVFVYGLRLPIPVWPVVFGG